MLTVKSSESLSKRKITSKCQEVDSEALKISKSTLDPQMQSRKKTQATGKWMKGEETLWLQQRTPWGAHGRAFLTSPALGRLRLEDCGFM